MHCVAKLVVNMFKLMIISVRIRNDENSSLPSEDVEL